MFLENFRVPILEGARVTKSGLVQCMLTDRSWATVGKLPEEGRMYDENRNRRMIPNGFYRFSCDYYYRKYVVDKDPDNIPPFFVEGAKIGPSPASTTC